MSILFSPLDKALSSQVSLRDQLCERISRHITQGLLEPNMRLPSCRKLSTHLSVSRNTVIGAYQSLIDEGFVEARERSGYFVHNAARAIPFLYEPRPNPMKPPAQIFDCLSPMVMPATFPTITRPADWIKHPYPFVGNQMDVNRFPLADWRKCNQQVLNRRNISAVTSDYSYGDCEELVAQIRNRLLPRRGIYVGEDEILITAGAQQAIFLTAMIMGGPTRTVGVEDPCYPDARNIFNLLCGDVLSIDLDDEGLICDDRLKKCDIVYVTPNHQYPSAVRMSKSRRDELHDHAVRHNQIIIEDDYDCETDYDVLREPALKSKANSDYVVYVGTLSKSLGPGLRLGYMVASPDLIRQARALRGMMIRHTPPLVQLTAAQFIRVGHYDAYISKLQGIHERRWVCANAAIKKYFPEAHVDSGWGGTNFMLTFEKHHNLQNLEDLALQNGVVIDDIQLCYSDPNVGKRKIRIGVSAIGINNIVPGIIQLRAVYDSMQT